MTEITPAGQTKSQKIENYPATYIIGFIVGFILFVVSLLLARTHELSGIQLSIFRDLNNLPDAYKQPALWVTEGLGAAYPIILCILIPAIYKRFRLSWRFFVTIGGTGVVMEAAKILAKEPRPFVTLHGHLHLRANELGLTSYPSGHMAVATAMALTLWMILPNRWRWLSILWILSVAFSRVYLGVHTPNDVVGGFAIGLMAVCFVRLLPNKIAKPLRLDIETPLLAKGWKRTT